VTSLPLQTRLQLRERLGRYFQRRENGNGKDDKSGEVKTGDVPSGDGNQ
jgi:hypothetical protein